MFLRSAAPLGASFTLIALISGAVWGKPTWGTWWVWDARLTSTLILFFLYVGIIGLYSSIDNKQRGDRAAFPHFGCWRNYCSNNKEICRLVANTSSALYFQPHFLSLNDCRYVFTTFNLCYRLLFHICFFAMQQFKSRNINQRKKYWGGLRNI